VNDLADRISTCTRIVTVPVQPKPPNGPKPPPEPKPPKPKPPKPHPPGHDKGHDK
jgi:outer membrane biosynthesis protein TonB